MRKKNKNMKMKMKMKKNKNKNMKMRMRMMKTKKMNKNSIGFHLLFHRPAKSTLSHPDPLWLGIGGQWATWK